VETALLTLIEKSQPEIVGLCTTGLTETRGDDMDGILRNDSPSVVPELTNLPIAFASTPDFKGALARWLCRRRGSSGTGYSDRV
jgi:nitrogenase molybdenum-iron protein alpha/beta subunit